MSSQLSNDIKVVPSEKLKQKVGNVYEAINIVAKRSNQLREEIKQELHAKLEEFTNPNDGIEDSNIVENKERIEVARYYEGLPKPHQVALEEFLAGKIYFRYPRD